MPGRHHGNAALALLREDAAHCRECPLGALASHAIVGGLPASTGRKMHFTGTTVLRLKGGKIVEEIGLDDGVEALTQLGLIKAAT